MRPPETVREEDPGRRLLPFLVLVLLLLSSLLVVVTLRRFLSAGGRTGATVRLVSDLRGAEAVTDERGRCVLAALPGIDERIVVTAKGLAPAWAVLPAESTDPVVVTMRAPAGR